MIFGDPVELIMLDLDKCGKYIVADIIFQHHVALCRSDFGAFVPSVCNIVHYSLYFIIGRYMFQPDWPSSGVQVVIIKESAAHSFLSSCCSCI
jgi:hypothetical protein